ncbi:type II toxin-antitoxin system RelB/DinJ family antitoxin [Streptococcus equi]|uniref:DNA-damage-inducible protein J n=1 Tax=Streptococcus equi subsp. equi TaxID=148942 RepID=A0A380JWV6_9STRE|nr:type II toxin-antitoxin system RelB/DinJ family antitoxin [Streptococcus equi]MCD3428621.1 type II toxin-antitoxin system RelB/DinJ family antitoxin [Streptococcus equi subsp. zooepidemicus]SUN49548.1 DNA-damage-inducible protein J [Streptococcus equi subsp. equi]HEL0581730.1 type II toxin-antitoxin system RelB/DinJ family antitoxin [Streptococcus equi subsp. zooepidemicus]HEL0611381.1 type II toxin-antitoxin system RelB/DinJ family antitoxin [Streptococcus equi subsp. zooepidemicus]HEL1109
MQVLEKNTQVNFKTNSDLLEKAKAVITAQNLDMTASFNLFLENIVQNNALPFETDADKERVELLADLRAEIAQSFDDLEHGCVYNASEVRANLGI